MTTSESVRSGQIRAAAVAGRFYPKDPRELRADVQAYLAATRATPGAIPKALIAPHAGYIFSGPIAASAYAHLAGARDRIKRVVLLGPAHTAAFTGIAVSRAEAFATPLGLVPVDLEAVRALSVLSQVLVLDEAHVREHSVEVQLPFLQTILADFKIVPLVVGDARDDEVSEVIEKLWGGPETLIVISSDLSHYYDYHSARRLDQATARAIERLCPEEIGEDQACGRTPMRGLLVSARRRGLSVRTVDLRNSGDTAGPRREVVGYGAWVFGEAAK